MTTPTHDHFEALLMKAVDGVLTDGEERELRDHLEGCASCREELADFEQITEATDMIRQRILAHARVEPPREGAVTRWLTVSAYFLLIGGFALVYGLSLHGFFVNPEIGLSMKIGAGGLIAGCLVMLATLIPGRLRALKHDPYREIDR